MKYENIGESEVTILGKGLIKPGEEVEMPKDFNNANFKLIKTSHKKVDEEIKED